MLFRGKTEALLSKLLQPWPYPSLHLQIHCCCPQCESGWATSRSDLETSHQPLCHTLSPTGAPRCSDIPLLLPTRPGPNLTLTLTARGRHAGEPLTCLADSEQWDVGRTGRRITGMSPSPTPNRHVYWPAVPAPYTDTSPVTAPFLGELCWWTAHPSVHCTGLFGMWSDLTFHQKSA